MLQTALNETHIHDVITDAIAAVDALALHDSIWNSERISRALEDLRHALVAVDQGVACGRLRASELDALASARTGFAEAAERATVDVRPRVRILLGRAERIEARVRGMGVAVLRTPDATPGVAGGAGAAARTVRRATRVALGVGAAVGALGVVTGVMAALLGRRGR